ncbi:MAG: toxin-activating lysine-acyltransferase [Hyphomicrobiaceae bacterium]
MNTKKMDQGGASQGASSNGSGLFSHAPPEGSARTISAVLGEIVWLMSQSPSHKQFFISDLEWFVMTPVMLQQFRTYYATDKPVGVVLWANVSDEVAERLAQGTTKLRPQDWKSGDKLWIVEVIAPFGGAEEMVKDLKDKVFPSRQVSFLAATKDGRQVRVL